VNPFEGSLPPGWNLQLLAVDYHRSNSGVN